MADVTSDEQIEDIAQALADGQKIEAIKIYRAATGKGLKDAKDFIDALIPKLVEQDPQKYANPEKSGTGCTSIVIVALLLSGAAAAVFVA